MGASFDPGFVATYFDDFGSREWDRHDADWAARISFELHRQFLGENIVPGDVVLEAGAGPGRFTIELARLGAWISVGDLSPHQVELNQQNCRRAGVDEHVVARSTLDICDLSELDTASFDAVVCYGGPLSYVLDRRHDALAELVRVTRPGGKVLLSVMTLAGAMRRSLPLILEEGRRLGPHRNDEVVATGALPRDFTGHECHLYRWSELREMLALHGDIVAAAATNFLSVGNDDAYLSATPEEKEQLTRWELDFCREPGVMDGGTHMLAVLQTHR